MAIFIDWNPLYIRCALCNGLYKQNPTTDTLRHMVLSCILSIKRNFPGNIIIAADSKKSWRKLYYPYYKVKRQQAREISNINWTELFDHANTILDEIKTCMPYITLKIDNTEADDIIAVLTKHIKENHVIISSDKDYKQLVSTNTCLYDPIKKKYHTLMDYNLLDHILQGDSADSIPNILSEDDCIAIGKKQTALTKQKREYYKSNAYNTWPEDIQHHYDRNNILINFDNIPTTIQQEIIKEYENYKKVPSNKLLTYFIEKKLKYLLSDIGMF